MVPKKHQRKTQHAPPRAPFFRRRLLQAARVMRWIKTHKRVSAAIGAGIIIAGISGHRAYRHYYPHRAPSFLMLGTHYTIADGREASRGLRNEVSKRKIAVVALENEGSTTQESQIILQEIAKKRQIFIEWKNRTPCSEEEARQRAEQIIGQSQNPFYVPIIAEAFVHGLPLRFIENHDPAQSKRIRELGQLSDQEFNRAKNASSIEEAIRHVEQSIKALDLSVDERDREMTEEISKLREEFRGKGAVFSWAGLGHFEVVNTTGSERLEQGRSSHQMGIDPETARKTPLRLRAARTYVVAYLEGVSRLGTAEMDQLFKRAQIIDEKDIIELDKAVGRKVGNAKGYAIVDTLLKWVNEKR
jgi:hypothetical protein